MPRNFTTIGQVRTHVNLLFPPSSGRSATVQSCRYPACPTDISFRMVVLRPMPDDSVRIFQQPNVNKLLDPKFIHQVCIHVNLPFHPAAGPATNH